MIDVTVSNNSNKCIHLSAIPLWLIHATPKDAAPKQSIYSHKDPGDVTGVIDIIALSPKVTFGDVSMEPIRKGHILQKEPIIIEPSSIKAVIIALPEFIFPKLDKHPICIRLSYYTSDNKALAIVLVSPPFLASENN